MVVGGTVLEKDSIGSGWSQVPSNGSASGKQVGWSHTRLKSGAT